MNHNQNHNQNQISLDRISLDNLIDEMQRFKNDLLSHSSSSPLPPFDWNFIQSITHLILVAQDLRECVENGNLEKKKKKKKNDSSGFTNASYTPSRERKHKHEENQENEENQNKKEMSFQERLHKIVLQFDALRTVQTQHSY